MFLLKRSKKTYIIFAMLIIFTLTIVFSNIPSTLLAQISNTDYQISSSVISAGGGISTAQGVVNNGVVGQPLISNIINNWEHNVASGFIYIFMQYEGDYCFRDFDGDGFGNPAQKIESTICPSGYVDNYHDCDDTNADINPDALEVCDEIDNNCDGFIDEEGEKEMGEDWMAEYNGPENGDDEAVDIAVGSSGNVYVTGNSKVGINSDYATVKYDINGKVIWARQYNGPGNGEDKATDMAVDSLENVYVTGWSYGNATEYAKVKYDANGNEIWVSRYNDLGYGVSYANAIAVDSLGNAYVTGESYS